MSMPATIWQPTDGHGEYSSSSAQDIIDTTGTNLIDPSSIDIISPATIFTQIPATDWIVNDSI